MDVEPIQDDDQRSLMDPMQALQIAHDVARPHVSILHDEVRSNLPSSRREAQTADDAQPIVSLRDDLLGSGADRRPRATVQRLQSKAGFIEKDERKRVVAEPFFNPRPIVRAPSLDHGFAPFGGPPLRLLRTEPKIVQDAAQVVGMVFDAKFAPYQFGHASTGPKLRREPGGAGTGDEQSPQPFTLRRHQLRRRAGTRLRLQRRRTA